MMTLQTLLLSIHHRIPTIIYTFVLKRYVHKNIVFWKIKRQSPKADNKIKEFPNGD